MLDAPLRRLIDPALDRAAAGLARAGVSADAATLAGLAIGAAAAGALALRWDLAALALILANRAADGLDGAISRRTAPTDWGGYLDIVCDFLVYSGLVFGFALGRPEHALAAAFLIFAFVGTGTSFLAHAAVAAKRGLASTLHPRKSFYYIGGLTEGSETILAFVLICLRPDWFREIAAVFGAMCWVTTLGRVLAARAAFRKDERE